MIALLFVLLIYFAFHLIFILFQRKFIFNNKRLPDEFVFSAPLPVNEINITTDDGERLNAAFQQPENMKGVVLYFHGNKHHLQRYLPYTDKFIEHRYGVLMPDFRSYGKSTGKLTEDVLMNDAGYFYNYLKNNFPNHDITIYGRSLGTAPATWLASKLPCKQLILEAPFYNMYHLARWYCLILPAGNYLQFSLRNDLHLQNVTCPVTIIHGNLDTTVPIFSGKKLKKFLKQKDRFQIINNGNHHNLEQLEQYRTLMDELLK